MHKLLLALCATLLVVGVVMFAFNLKSHAPGKAPNETAEKNPAKPVKFFQANNARVRYLTQEEEARLKGVFPLEHWSKVEVAINTGMRRG